MKQQVTSSWSFILQIAGNSQVTGGYFLAQQQPPPPHPPVSHGLLIHEVSRSHTKTEHTRWDSSGRVISSSKRPLPENTRHSQQISMPMLEFEPIISGGERPQTYAFDRAATGTGKINIHYTLHKYSVRNSQRTRFASLRKNGR